MLDAFNSIIPNNDEAEPIPMDIDYEDVARYHSDEVEDEDDEYWSDTDNEEFGGNVQEISHAGGEYGPNVSVAQRTFSLMTSTNKYICLFILSCFTVTDYNFQLFVNSMRRFLKRGQSINRRDRIQALQSNWDNQIEDLADAYLKFKHDTNEQKDSLSSDAASVSDQPTSNLTSPPSGTPLQSPTSFYCTTVRERCRSSVYTCTLFFKFLTVPQAREQIIVIQQPEQSVNQALIQIGFLGTSPVEPTIAIELEVLELYYRLRRRFSRYGILPFVRALCDLQKVRQVCLSVLLCDE